MQQANPMQYYFEVIEHNEFKRLVHLSLKTGPATDADIKKHMADTILNLKVISNVLIIIMIKILVYRLHVLQTMNVTTVYTLPFTYLC